MNDGNDVFGAGDVFGVSLISGLIIGIILSGFVGYLTVDDLQDKAIKSECARYHPTTGAFEFIKKDNK